MTAGSEILHAPSDLGRPNAELTTKRITRALNGVNTRAPLSIVIDFEFSTAAKTSSASFSQPPRLLRA